MNDADFQNVVEETLRRQVYDQIHAEHAVTPDDGASEQSP